jgi:putative RecB family exonuclease
MVHECLFRLHKDDKLGFGRSLDDILIFYRQEWEELWDENVHIIQAGLTQDHFKSRGERYIRDYHQRYIESLRDVINIISLEEKSMMDLPDGNQFFVIIDRLSRVGNDFTVCDYKTSTTLLDLQEAFEDRQLAMYALWVKEKFPDVGRVIQQWQMLHYNKVLEIEHRVEELEGFRENVVRKISEIENCTDFSPSRSKLCEYCEYKSICPEMVSLLKMKDSRADPLIGEDSAKLVDELQIIEETLKMAKQRKTELEKGLIRLSEDSGSDVIQGSKATANITLYDVVEMPEHYTEFLIEHGLLAKYGCVSSSKVRSSVLKGTADPLIVNTVQRTTEKKVRLIRR